MAEISSEARIQRDLRFCQTNLTADGEQPNLTATLVRTPEQRAADFLRHVRHDWYVYTYASCRACGHSEIAHNAHGCEAVDEQGAPCECRR